MTDTTIPPAVPESTPEPLRVLLAVPTRGYPWHETAKALEPYNPQYCREKLSVANVRNRIVRQFLDTDAQILVMCDDDVVPGPGFIDVLANCPYDIVGAPVPIAKMPAHEVFLNVFTVEDDGRIITKTLPETGHMPCDAVGSGIILIHRHVLEDERMKRPFEQMLDDDGCILVGQDLQFCRRARAAGFSIGVSADALCDHYISLHANSIALAYHPEALNGTRMGQEATARYAAAPGQDVFQG